MDQYDVKFYKIDLEVTDASTYLAGSASVLIQVLDNPVNELVFDLLSELTVDSVLLDGKKAEFTRPDNQLIVSPAAELERTAIGIGDRILFRPWVCRTSGFPVYTAPGRMCGTGGLPGRFPSPLPL